MSFDPIRHHTQARIGLGTAGHGLPTKAWLLFALHHARAVDAIKMPWDIEQQTKELLTHGIKSRELKTQVSNREEYLVRPDLGRMLDHESQTYIRQKTLKPHEIVIFATNGLSSLAVRSHLSPFLAALLPELKSLGLTCAFGHIFLVQNARVALIDEIGALLKPKIGITIVGERAGLSAPDSLAVYLTYAPKKKRTDAERNCVSNIRPPHGLSIEEALKKTLFLIDEALRRKISGFLLKEESDTAIIK